MMSHCQRVRVRESNMKSQTPLRLVLTLLSLLALPYDIFRRCETDIVSKRKSLREDALRDFVGR